MVPEHVLRAFQLDGPGEAVPTAWGAGRRFGKVVVAPAGATSVWSGKVREKLAGSIDGVRIARPVRATDGRLVVGGFAANEFVEGSPQARVDEVVGASLLIDASLATTRTQPPTIPAGASGAALQEADRAVWAGEDMPVEGVVAHLTLLRRCLFDGYEPVLVADFEPSLGLRPRGYTAALAIVDGLLAGAVDDRILARWAHVPHLDWLAVKALELREASVAAMDANMRTNFRRVAAIVSS